MKQDAHLESIFTAGTFGADLGTVLPIIIGLLTYVIIAFSQHHYERAKYLKSVLSDNIDMNIRFDESNFYLLTLLRQKHLVLGGASLLFSIVFVCLGGYYIINLATSLQIALIMAAFLLMFFVHRTVLMIYLFISARNENRVLHTNRSSELHNEVLLKPVKIEGVALTLHIIMPLMGMIGFGWLLFRLVLRAG